MEISNIPEASIEDTFRILIATDTHLGYAESDPERGDDSFNSFEEVLQLAKAHKVDFLLLGGDLFHENKPSTHCLHRCMALLREYCMGDDPISIEFLSDQHLNFQHCSQQLVNYEDPNLNISIPVFSIHGNHDDPSGQKQLSAMDILSTSGLVNYFGKWSDLTEVKISPILLKKGKSKLALYGLSHIKDERLSRLFRDHKVQMYRPSESSEDWFNIFVCHQNRADRGINKTVHEEALPKFLDLVVWGHEHECRLKEEFNGIQGFYVTQPGSSVATSLCEGEAKEKFVGLLQVYNKKFKLTPLPLKSVRPFIFETITLSECTIPVTDSTSNSVQLYLEDRIEFWLQEATRLLTDHEKQPQLPLLRVRVEYSEEAQCFNTIRFGQKYQSRVANPTDMIMLKREKPAPRKPKVNDEEEKEGMQQFLENEEIADVWEVKMNVLMQKYFDEVSNKKLQVFSVKGISDAVARFIDKSDRESIKMIVDHQMTKIEQHLCKNKVEVDHIDEEINKYMHERLQNSADETAEYRKLIESIRPLPKKEEAEVSRIQNSDDDDTDNDVVMEEEPVAPPTRGRGSRARRGRATTTRETSARATTSRARGRARGSQSTSRASATLRSNTTALRNGNQSSTRDDVQYDDSDDD